MDRVESYLNQLSLVVTDMPQADIWNAIDVLMSAWERQAMIYTMGNGGSASTASHMANDLNKLTIVEGQPRFRSVCITDNVPLVTAWANDSAYEHAFAEPLRNLIRQDDVLIVISGSGNSPSVIEAVEVANKASAVTLGYTSLDGGQLKLVVDHCIRVPTNWIVQQEDAHLILNHCIATTLRGLIEERAAASRDATGSGAAG